MGRVSTELCCLPWELPKPHSCLGSAALVKYESVWILILIGQHININQLIYTSHDNER